MSEGPLILGTNTDSLEAWWGHFASADLLHCSYAVYTVLGATEHGLFAARCTYDVVILLRLNNSQKDLREETLALLWGDWHWCIKLLVGKMQCFRSLCNLFWIFLYLMQICNNLPFNIERSVYRYMRFPFQDLQGLAKMCTCCEFLNQTFQDFIYTWNLYIYMKSLEKNNLENIIFNWLTVEFSFFLIKYSCLSFF